VEQILASCPRVVLVATSREPLHVHGEQLLRLRPLELDAAIELFLTVADRAGATIDAARWSGQIEDLCRHLDGLPLAIELAGAHTARLPIDQVHRMFSTQLEQLDNPTRGVPRHRTLETALRWSYDLLDPPLRQLLRRLAVFAGRFSEIHAAAVFGVNTNEITPLLGALVDKSFVSFDPNCPSYRLLETVRAFARRLLAEEGETNNTYERLNELAAQIAPGPWTCWLQPPKSDEGVLDSDSLRGLLAWSVRHNPPRAAAVVAADLRPWFTPAHAAEAMDYLQLDDRAEWAMTLDERLAIRVARTWLAVALLDLQEMTALHEHVQLTPTGHPAYRALRFVQAWLAVTRDRRALPALVADVRAASRTDPIWTLQATLLEGMAALLDRQHANAISAFRSALDADDNTDSPYPQLFLALAYHAAGEHDRMSLLAQTIDIHHRDAFLADLIAEYVLVLEAIGRGDREAMRTALQSVFHLAEHSYPHVHSAIGMPIQASAAVAHANGQHADCITLVAGTRRRRLHVRFEGAAAISALYRDRSRQQLSQSRHQQAATLGAELSLNELVALAKRHIRSPSVGDF
jgi:predicted ATPase